MEIIKVKDIPDYIGQIEITDLKEYKLD